MQSGLVKTKSKLGHRFKSYLKFKLLKCVIPGSIFFENFADMGIRPQNPIISVRFLTISTDYKPNINIWGLVTIGCKLHKVEASAKSVGVVALQRLQHLLSRTGPPAHSDPLHLPAAPWIHQGWPFGGRHLSSARTVLMLPASSTKPAWTLLQAASTASVFDPHRGRALSPLVSSILFIILYRGLFLFWCLFFSDCLCTYSTYLVK